MICVGISNCVAANFDRTTQTCRVYDNAIENQDANEENSALVWYEICPYRWKRHNL